MIQTGKLAHQLLYEMYYVLQFHNVFTAKILSVHYCILLCIKIQ